MEDVVDTGLASALEITAINKMQALSGQLIIASMRWKSPEIHA